MLLLPFCEKHTRFGLKSKIGAIIGGILGPVLFLSGFNYNSALIYETAVYTSDFKMVVYIHPDFKRE